VDSLVENIIKLSDIDCIFMVGLAVVWIYQEV
jgi:hypothetical protein